MSSVNLNSNVPVIREANITTDRSNSNKVDSTKVENQPQINTKDNMSVKNLKNSSFDPASSNVNFGNNEEEKQPQRINMFTPILSALLMLSSGTASEETMELTKNQLNESAKFVSQHGSSYEMNMFGGAKAKDESQRFKEMSELPKK